MKAYVTRVLTFCNHAHIGGHQALLTVNAPGLVDLPDWVRSTDTFTAGVRAGAIAEIGVPAPAPLPDPLPAAENATAGVPGAPAAVLEAVGSAEPMAEPAPESVGEPEPAKKKKGK